MMGQRIIFDPGQRGGAAGLIAGLGDDRKDRLAVELHQAIRQDRVVVQTGRADIVDARQIARHHHIDDTGRGAHRIQIHRQDAAMGTIRQAQRGMQRALRLDNIVGVIGGAGHMQARRFMRGVLMGEAGDRAGMLVILHGHSPTARFRRTVPPACSSQKRRKKLPATAWR